MNLRHYMIEARHAYAALQLTEKLGWEDVLSASYADAKYANDQLITALRITYDLPDTKIKSFLEDLYANVHV